ncbi:MAG: transposase [Gemmataceae bacterium]
MTSRLSLGYHRGMGRALRADAGGLVYHVLNRANARLKIFAKPGDYQAFETVLAQGQERFGTRILSYCLMPNHWHLVLWPRADGELSRFVGWLTLTHTQRWHAHYHNVGSGHLYQGRFKSFAVEEDEPLLTLCRYVERNPLRAGLVDRAQLWCWCSLWRREHGGAAEQALLSDWPVPRPRGWLGLVQQAQTAAEEEALRRCVQRGQPFGTEAWVSKMVRVFGLETTLRARGRPRKATEKGS